MGVDRAREQDWKQYANSVVLFSLAGWLLLFLILRTQSIQPWNNYGGRQLPLGAVGCHVQHGLVVHDEHELAVLRRRDDDDLLQPDGRADGPELRLGRCRHRRRRRARARDRRPHELEPRQLLRDFVRTVLYVLLPISIISALVLISQGSIQNLAHYVNVHGVSGLAQTIAMGPVASQEAIKELGTNGGGFFNVNSSHPFENPNGFTNFYEMWLVLLIPASLVWMYGKMVGSRRQALAIFATMFVMFIGGVTVAYAAEAHGSPRNTLPACTRRSSRTRPAATWRARSSASASPAPPSSMSSRPSPRAARSTARSSPTRGLAARFRWRTCRRAR